MLYLAAAAIYKRALYQVPSQAYYTSLKIKVFLEMSTPQKCELHCGPPLNEEPQPSQPETSTQIQEGVYLVRPPNTPFDLYSVTTIYPYLCLYTKTL